MPSKTNIRRRSQRSLKSIQRLFSRRSSRRISRNAVIIPPEAHDACTKAPVDPTFKSNVADVGDAVKRLYEEEYINSQESGGTFITATEENVPTVVNPVDFVPVAPTESGSDDDEAEIDSHLDTVSVTTKQSASRRISLDGESPPMLVEVSDAEEESDVHCEQPTQPVMRSSNIPLKKLRSEKQQNNTSFEVGDEVIVADTKHAKHGKIGVVYKVTASYVFFQDSAKVNVKIMSKFLERVLLRSDAEIEGDDAIKEDATEESYSKATTKTQPRRLQTRSVCGSLGSVDLGSRKSSTIVMNTTSSPERPPFSGDRVIVVKKGHKHKGKLGTVKRMTAKFAFVVFDLGDEKEVRITPSFLEYLPGEGSDVPSTTKTNSHPSGIASHPLQRFGSYVVQKLILDSPECGVTDGSIIGKIWGDRLLPVDIPVSEDMQVLEKIISWNGDEYELYYADVAIDTENSILYNKKKKVKAYYVRTSNLEFNLRGHEETLADFGSLEPRKVWSRRSLLFSTAVKINTEFAIHDVSDSEVVMVEDVGTTGCGFIDEQNMMKLLGESAAAKRTVAIQVRMLIPTLGLFKGVLVRKKMNGDHVIEMNESLQKVPPSRVSVAENTGWMLIKRVFPSKANEQVGRIFQKYGREVTNSFKRELKSGKQCKLADMYQRIIIGSGVPSDVMKHYSRTYKTPDKLRHTHLVGVADPTNELPPNTVFVTGVNGGFGVDQIFVSRSPATEVSDGRVVELVNTKPFNMSQANWDWLGSLPFGAIMFGNPEKGYRPLPECIANGDLDGDWYFVFWSEALLQHIHAIPFIDNELSLPAKVDVPASVVYNSDWYDNAQNFMSKVSLQVDVDKLICELYNLSLTGTKNMSKNQRKGDFFKHIGDPDAVSYGRAYKQALEFKKHGRNIPLPEHLFSSVSEKYHEYLTPI